METIHIATTKRQTKTFCGKSTEGLLSVIPEYWNKWATTDPSPYCTQCGTAAHKVVPGRKLVAVSVSNTKDKH